MKKHKKTLTCIDIGTDSLKVITGQVTPENKISVKDYSIIKYPAGSFEKYDFDIFKETISDFLNKKKIKDLCVLSISNPKEMMQTLNIPDMPKAEIHNAIKWELSQKKQFDPEKSSWDYIYGPITYDPNSKDRKVFVTINKKEHLDQLQDIATAKKLKLESIENPNFAAINALIKLGSFPTNKAYVILNLCAAYSYVLIVHDGRLIFERRLNTGGYSITKSISTYCKADMETADAIKKEHGFSSESEDEQVVAAKNIMTSSLEKLVSDIQYSLKYFSFQVTKSKVTTYEKVIMTGGFSKLKGLREFLQERLSLDCTMLDFSNNVTLPKNHAFQDDNDAWPVLNTCLGLFFWNSEEKNEFCSTLIESIDERASQSFAGKFKKTLKTYFICTVLFISLVVVGGTKVTQMNTKIKDLKNEHSSAEQLLAEEKKRVEADKNRLIELDEEKRILEARLELSSSKLKAINEYKIGEGDHAKIIQLFSAITPEKLYINKITSKQDLVNISGISTNHDNIVKFMKSLNKSSFFTNCHFVYAKKSEQSSYIEFELKAEKTFK